MLKKREAVLIVNTRSRMGTEWLKEAEEKLAASGLKVVHSQGFSKIDTLINHIKAEKDKGRIIVVGGGDGTMNVAANLIGGTDNVMGVLPLGTGNAFARDLGIPVNLDKAIDIIVNGISCEVDLGVYDKGYFLNVATIGLTVEVAKTLNVAMKRRFGRFVYAIAWARALRKTEPFCATIETENGTTTVNTIQLVVGNGHYHGGPLPLAPTAAITSGKLRLYAVEAASTVDLIKYALILPTGLQGALKTVHSEATTHGVVTCDPIQAVVVDGELGAKTPLKFSVQPMALKVMAPQSFKG